MIFRGKEGGQCSYPHFKGVDGKEYQQQESLTDTNRQDTHPDKTVWFLLSEQFESRACPLLLIDVPIPSTPLKLEVGIPTLADSTIVYPRFLRDERAAHDYSATFLCMLPTLPASQPVSP